MCQSWHKCAKQLLTYIDTFSRFLAPAKTLVKILKKSDHGLTVCSWGPCCFGRLRVKLVFFKRCASKIWGRSVRSDLKKLDSFTLETSKNYLIRYFPRNGRVRVKKQSFICSTNLSILREKGSLFSSCFHVWKSWAELIPRNIVPGCHRLIFFGSGCETLFWNQSQNFQIKKYPHSKIWDTLVTFAEYCHLLRREVLEDSYSSTL